VPDQTVGQGSSRPLTGRPAGLPTWRYDTKLWMRDLKEGAAYLPK
jgi:hypothetical protein